ncbi:putative bifunctional diguanylate cyclase/phosphodiesterase [Catenovulum adriaticum]|uniref:Bifunctional diguanylate cyclase/phosphodiesterase n=1 Tax=Catenovulum adriaticum TaxID=2984846 RepID=A0ABY7AIW7_9ALTE|nr:bifunctional diguanylate cyclase/phosphodiesterase [Catenovulum sp. TS8]WAJ69173.1 bifunctional diguanylate cyclase/phosphodiesterase [Catenovulum sp. TS8]
MDNVISDALIANGQAIFICPDPQQASLVLVAGESDWLQQLLPQAKLNQAFNLEEQSYFLQDFLIDAKALWGNSVPGQLNSGFWTEALDNHISLHLDAKAIKTDTNNVLILTNQADAYSQKQKTLQAARNILLANDQLQAQYEHLHNKLLSMINTSHSVNNLFTPVVSAVENASFGVIIFDAEFNVIIENPAVFKTFEVTHFARSTLTSPSQIMLKLMRSQLPEFSRLIETSASWNGELCWMKPPHTLKWLKVGFYPVRTDKQTLSNWLFFVHDISREKYLLQQNESLSQQDVLTSLFNRSAFWQYLENQVAEEIPFFLLYIDIAQFKQINEFYGHNEGDQLLIELSRRLSNLIAPTDFLARMGGDEFAIVLNNIDSLEKCKAFSQKLFSLTNQPFYTQEDESYLIGLKVGAVSYPHDSLQPEDLLKFADLSAYSANKKTRNAIQFYSQELKEASHRRIDLEQALKLAIENDELLLNLQPILNLKTLKIEKAEVLVRWNRPDEGIVMPSEFIAIAEKTGLIVPLGKWVFNKAAEYLKQLERSDIQIKLSINLSPMQVMDSSFFEFIKSTIERQQVDPTLLELEVTESSLINDYNEVFNLLNSARGLGLSVSVDDFGTGYSSLAYLKRLPIDILKIDRSFVQDIATDANDKAIVMAVIAMAHQLKLKVIAEGVETQEQQRFLVDNECDSAQGYLFSRPILFADFVKLISSQWQSS